MNKASSAAPHLSPSLTLPPKPSPLTPVCGKIVLHATGPWCQKGCGLLLLGIYLDVELLDYMIILFNFVRNHHTIFHNDCTILHSHQQCTSVPILPHPHQHLLFYILFDDSYPNRCDVISHCGLGLHFPNN